MNWRPLEVRFHHRLVKIHPFPNGNGRHSRLMADLLVMSVGGERFSWPKAITVTEDCFNILAAVVAKFHPKQVDVNIQGACANLFAIAPDC